MSSNPLEGLNIRNDGDGSVNIVLNVDGQSALDYLKDGINKSSGKKVKKDTSQYEPIANEPMLDDRGLPPYGTFGNWTYTDKGHIVCHMCGNSFSSKQAFVGHIGTHNVTKDMYSEVYNVIFDELM